MKIIRQNNGGLYFRLDRADRQVCTYRTFLQIIRDMRRCVFRPAEMDDRPGEDDNRWCWVPPFSVPEFERAKKRYIDDYLESDRIIAGLESQGKANVA